VRRSLPTLVLVFAASCQCGHDPNLNADAVCSATDAEVLCPPRITTVDVNGAQREVYWQAPHGEAPDAGRPVVVVYQGSFFGPSATWGTVKPDLAFGGFHQARLQVMLLEHGFTVVAPSAVAGVAWQTNATVPWGLTTDKVLVDGLLAGLDAGQFGAVDLSRLYATGISSGGYMTSRMALSYPGAFRALAIQSASWATCAGPVCVLPDALPADHPPTLFLHGANDATVPLFTAQPYVTKLMDQGTPVELDVEDAGHEWFADSPDRITGWFEAH